MGLNQKLRMASTPSGDSPSFSSPRQSCGLIGSSPPCWPLPSPSSGVCFSASSRSCTSGSSAPSCGSSRPCSRSSVGSGLFSSTPPLRLSVTLSGESSRRPPGLFNPPEQIVFGLLILSRQPGAENEIQRRSHEKTLRLMCECSPPLNVDHSGNSTNAEIANVSQDQTLK